MSKHYIDNTRFEECIRAYLTGNTSVEGELFSMFHLLIENIMGGFGFDVDREDAVQECFLLILKVMSNFNPDNGSAFNFFTTVIVNNLKLIYTKNKKYADKLDNYKELLARRQDRHRS